MMSLKKWSKKIAMLAVSLGMVFGTGMTAFAYVQDDVNAEAAVETVQEEEPQAETPSAKTEPEEENGQAFSVPGNGEVVDNIKDGSSKEFYTITTANNNTYYLVIDHSAATDNVYMLSRIDEADLKDFIEEGSAETPETTPAVVMEEETQAETPSAETEPEKENPGSAKGAMAVLILAALCGIGAYGYFKVYKPRQEDDDTESEHMETEMFQTVNEDEETKDEAEESDGGDEEE